MKTINKTLVALLTALMTASAANAQGLSDLLGTLGNAAGSSSQNGKNNGGSNTLSNLLEGVFSSSDITVRDMAGVWTSNGPAVSFQSENFLKKAGGKAAAAVVENKLAPYYNTLGLNGSVLTVETDGTFSLKTKMLTLQGDITPIEGKKGVFNFNFSVMGMKLIAVTTFVEKTSNTMNIMFDASKLINLLSAVSKVVNIKTLSTITGILNGYDGLCVGLRTEKTGTVAGENDGNEGGSAIGSLLNGLGLGGSNQNNNGTTGNNRNSSNTNNKNTTGSSSTGSGSQNQENLENNLNALRNLLGGSKKK